MTDYLNVRSGPSASLPKVATLTPGQQVRTTSRTANGYQQVVFQGRTRWVQAKYLTDAAPASSRTLGAAAVAKSTRKVTASAPSAAAKAPSSVSTALVRGAYLTDNVNLRSAAGTDQKSLGILPAHSYLTLRGATVDGWAPVSAAGHSGWVKAAFLSTTKPAAIVPASLRAPSASTPAQTAKKASATKSAAAKNAASVRRIVYASVGVNVRSGAGTAFRTVGQLSQGDYVGTRGAAVGGWTPVSFQGKAGWVKSSLLSTSKPKVSASSAGSAGSVRRIVYASVGVNVRSGAGTAFRTVGQLSQGDYVGTRGAAVGGWTPVSFQGKAGWVKSSLLSTSKPKVSASSAGSAGSVRRIVYASVGVNVRSGAGTAFRTVGQLSQGDYVGTRGAAVGGWTPVSFQGKAGWVKSSLLSTSKPKVSASSAGSAGSVRRIVYASVGVNVRSGAGTAFRTVGQLSQGDYVGTRGAAVGGWTPVSFQGKAGWVKSSLLSTSKPKVSASSAGSAGSVRRIVYASVGVNVRSGAGTAFRTVGQLSQGDYVGTRGAAVGGWTPVSFQGKAGWVKSSLLSTSKPKVSASSSRTNASSVSGTVTSTTPRSYSSVPSSGGVDPWGFYWGQCVSYVAWQVRSNTGHSNFQNMYRGVHFGNAENWGSAARSLGITVNSTPTVGSVAWRTSGSAGHVAYVTAVHSNGTIDVSEYNYLVTSGFDTRSNVNWQSGGSSGFDGFIHF
ncbi:Staphylococcal secretory antigen ssaA2 precursor [Acidipropionibacterium jensenii]|uniref:N-acetylmuramoyl-L-alanine amidase n=4 Tax=Acidipropionibacterium jensenii TaxID=1749 RepID=A0A448NWH2_9ACTN|nr:SH3 domain-containing protein [Acidipropionibacterium jensenii]VEI02295.1 Staphylococcal secretory antigen ssaA2 precursor [Acidipropionibacterium jensenii]